MQRGIDPPPRLAGDAEAVQANMQRLEEVVHHSKRWPTTSFQIRSCKLQQDDQLHVKDCESVVLFKAALDSDRGG